jgi:hypothetical protein
MAKLGNIHLLDQSAGQDCGGAFLLAKPCEINETVKLDSGWEVEIQDGNPYAVARGWGADDHNTAYLESLEVVQQALDLLSICNLGVNTIRNASGECIVWWQHAGVQVLRLNMVHQRGSSMSTLGITTPSADGSEELLIPNIGKVKHHESMRFFRFSQLADDVFDAYRNLWLAMETLLDYVSPRPTKASETAWIEQAFNEVLLRQATAEGVPDPVALFRALVESSIAHGSVNLHEALRSATEGVPSLPSAAVFVTDQYKETRCRLFHSGRRLSEGQPPPLLPDKLDDRAYLRKRLIELSWIYRQAANAVFGIRAAFGHIPPSFHDGLASLMVDEANIAVTDASSPTSHELDHPDTTQRTLIRLATVPAPYGISGMRAFIGSGDLASGSYPAKITATALVLRPTHVLRNDLEATLHLSGISKLEVFMALWSQDTNQPEFVFPDPPWLR